MILKQKRLFVTGTDTEVGKTLFTCALIVALQNAGVDVMAFKPIAAGSELVDGQLQNEDAQALIKALNINPNYQTVNPFAMRKAIAPHIAADDEDVILSSEVISKACSISNRKEPIIIVEGAGGWFVPLNSEETLADFVMKESLDVILVVGLKLGCINHALLTQHAIRSDGLNLIGWVANHIDPDMLEQTANIQSLKQRLDCPLIAEIPFMSIDETTTKIERRAANYIHIDKLIE